MMPRTYVGVVLAAALAAAGCSHAAAVPQAPSPAGAEAGGARATRSGSGGIKPYAEVIPATARTDSGLVQVHKVGSKYFFEIPNAMLDREMLLVTRIARTADNLGYGGEEENTQVVRWQRLDDRVLLRTVSYRNVATDTLPIERAVRSSNFEPIIQAFQIEALSPDTQGVVIEVTSLYSKDVASLGISKASRDRYKVRRLDESRTFVNWMKSFPRNVEVRATLTYDATEPPSQSSTGTISVEMNHSMVLLPEDPMRPRLCDERVGYFSVRQVDYGLEQHRATTRCYIARWRLEPKDTAAFRRGELVEPVKPIVYYIDPATPMKWRPFLKQGVEDWNRAFAAAGFRNAIIAKDPPTPEEDPEFSPEDVRYSVIRYFSSPVQNAYGPHVSDPRTGEILESDIGWYHNIQQLLRNWYLVQTAAANPDARRVQFDDELMGQLIRFVATHEVGHTLGFPHNMKASSAYPADSLRSASFTCRMGTAPSIMDYARFNYVAQPGDEGVCFMPGIGPYDLWAAEWGYRPILDTATPDAEKRTLNEWIKAHDEPIYWFGNPSNYDPTSLTEALADDGVQASAYGVENLKRIVPRLLDWTYQEGEPYDQASEIYEQVIGQWNRYMGHVATVVGGVHRNSRTYDQEGTVYTVVPEARQREAMRFIDEQALQTPRWLLDEAILSRVGHAPAVDRVRRLQAGVVNNLLDPRRMQRLIEFEARHGTGEVYTLGEFMTDLRRAVWAELGTGRSIDAYRRNLQRAYLERVEWLMTEEPPPIPAQFRARADVTDVDVSQSDIRAFARGELVALQGQIRSALARGPDRATRLHLLDAQKRIERILEPRG